MPSPLRDRIATANANRPRKAVGVPEWGETVYVRKLSADEWVVLASEIVVAAAATPKEQIDALARLTALVLVDENGQPVFDQRSNDDLAVIRQSEPSVLRRIQDAVADFNGVTPKDAADATASFDGRQGSASPSA
jgi:hypothetical protein